METHKEHRRHKAKLNTPNMEHKTVTIKQETWNETQGEEHGGRKGKQDTRTQIYSKHTERDKADKDSRRT